MKSSTAGAFNCCNSLLIAICVAVIGIGVTAYSDETAVWTAAAHPSSLANGIVQIEYDSSWNVTALTATPANGETVSLSGDALPLANGTELRMAAVGKLVIANELTGNGRVVVTNADVATQIIYDGTLLSTNRWTTMFSGRQLADYAPVKSIRREGSGVYDQGIYYPYNVRRYEEGGVVYMSIQLMASQPTTTRALLMRLRQNGDNIEGIVDRACYYTGRFIHGEDVEKVIARHAISPEDGFVPNYYVHTPDFDHGYGVNHFIMEKTAASEIVFAGAAATTLSFAVQPGIRARVAPSGLTEATPFALNGGTTVVNGRGGFDFASTMSGHGTLALSETETADADTCTDSYAGFIKSAVNVSSNRRLATLTNVTAKLSGSYFSGTRYDARFYRYPNGNGLSITGELQVASNETTLRFVLLAIEQNTHNIRASVIKAGYLRIQNSGGVNATTIVGKYSVYDENIPNRGTAWNPNFDDARTVATSDTGAHIGACDFCFMYSEPAGEFVNVGGNFHDLLAPAEIVRDVQNAYEEVKLCVAGTSTKRMLARVNSDFAYPTNGVVEIGAYGELRSDKQGSEGGRTISYDTALIRVLQGGLLRACNTWAIGSYQNIHLVGGTLMLRDDLATAASDSYCYCNLLTFRDGALATGAPMRVGFAGAASWRVAGSASSICEANLLLSSLNNNTYKTAEFNVTDVTDDDGIDFHLRGNVDALDNSHSNVVLRKTGGGTLAQYGAFGSRLAAAPVRIEAGTWLLCGTESANQGYVLSGGTLAIAAGTVNSAGRLWVNSSGTLKVAIDGSVAFEDSSAADWAIPDGAKCQIDADLSNGAVRFGRNANALTQRQLARLRHGTARVKLDANGYLRDYIKGTSLAIR